MTNVLRIDSSVTGEASVTNRLNQLLVETIAAGATVVHRDATQLPSLSSDLFVAGGTAAADRTPAQASLAAVADEAISELESADILIIGAPIYNFGVPSGLKAWMDLITRAGRTFRYTETGGEGLLEDKRTYITTASGGVPIGSEVDFATPQIRTLLEFLGIRDITLIGAGGMMIDPSALEAAEARIRELAPTS